MRLISVFIFFILASAAVFAQMNSIKGKVLDEKDNSPLLGVNILVEELKTGTTTDTNGDFTIQNVPAGNYRLRFSYIGHKTVTVNLEIPSKDELIVLLKEGSVDLNEIVVTGNPFAVNTKELSQSILSLSNLDMQIRRSSTIAQTLNFQPGISMRSNGIAASRPVIRGFSNNRVLILENGLRMGDLSNTSDDHGVSSDGSSAERLEVLRGPASLLYGSNALGGVINIITEAIPRYIPARIEGNINISSAIVNKEFAGSADMHYGIDKFAFHGNYFRRNSSNYMGGNGVEVENSAQFADGYQFGISFIPSYGLGGLSYSSFSTKYGIPVKAEEGFTGEEEDDHDEEHGHAHDAPIDIEMNKQEFRIMLESSKLGSVFNSFSLKAGYQDYDHKEILKESGEVETSFGLKTYSADLSFNHKPFFKNLQGVFGIYLFNQNYTVEGEEAFTPNAYYFGIAGYFVEQLKIGRFNLQFGARFERNSIKIPESVISEQFFPAEEKDYNSLSASLGIVYNLTEEISFFSNFANAFRSPTIEELASYSIHAATGTFDIGNRRLSNEKNIGIDAGFRLRKYHHLVELSAYYNVMHDYIFRSPTGIYYNPEDFIPINDNGTGIPVFQYLQSDATLFGFELKAQYEITRFVSVTAIMDYVRGKQNDDSSNLPQMPPFRFSIEPRYSDDDFWLGLNWKLVADQNLVAAYETPSKGYGLIDIYVGTKILSRNNYHIVNLRAENILNQSYRDHLSSIKGFAFMPGRNIRLSYKFLF